MLPVDFQALYKKFVADVQSSTARGTADIEI
jgi:hypothetical protein